MQPQQPTWSKTSPFPLTAEVGRCDSIDIKWYRLTSSRKWPLNNQSYPRSHTECLLKNERASLQNLPVYCLRMSLCDYRITAPKVLWNTLQKKMSKNSSIESNPPKPEIFTTLALPTGSKIICFGGAFIAYETMPAIWRSMPSILQKPFAYLLWALLPCKGAFLRTSFPDINSLSRHVSFIFPCFSAARTVGSCRHCTLRLSHETIVMLDWQRSCSKCYGMDCFGTYFTHAQTCDNVRVQSATEWTASVHSLHTPKPVITFVFQVLRNGLLRNILYTCPKPVITFVFQVLRNGLLRNILYTCPNLW